MLERVDVGLCWRPGGRADDPWAVANRDGTRMAWWWSHGIPVIGYPMIAFGELAARVGYPRSLVNVTTADDLTRALCQIASPAQRSCLAEVSRAAGVRTSPQVSGQEFRNMICTLRAPSCRAARATAAELANFYWWNVRWQLRSLWRLLKPEG